MILYMISGSDMALNVKISYHAKMSLDIKPERQAIIDICYIDPVLAQYAYAAMDNCTTLQRR